MARVFALIRQGYVTEIVNEVSDIDKEWTPGFVAMCVDLTGVIPAPSIGWSYDGHIFAAPSQFVPTKSQQMTAALMMGCQIVSTGTPALNAVYDAVGGRWQNMFAEVSYINAFDGFSGGLTELDWPAKSGDVIFTNATQFKSVTRAIADWITGWQRFVDAKADAAPAAEVTIA